MSKINPIWSALSFLFKKTEDKSEIAFFKDVILFQDLKNREIEKVLKLMYTRTYNDGEYVFHKGQPGTAFYIIRRGTVRIVEPGEPPSDIAVLNEGELFGELSILDDSPRSASALASGSVELRGIYKHDFDKMLVNEPLIVAKLYQKFATIIGVRLKVSNDEVLRLAKLIEE